MNKSKMSVDELENAVGKAKNGDLQAMVDIINHFNLKNSMAVQEAVRKSYRQTTSLDDILQEANIAIIQAVRSYNPQNGDKYFEAYARKTVRFKLSDAYHKSYPIRISRYFQKKAEKTDDGKLIFISLSETTDFFDIPDEDFQLESIEDDVVNQKVSKNIEKIINSLNNVKEDMVRMRYGFSPYDCTHTFAEIGKKYNMKEGNARSLVMSIGNKKKNKEILALCYELMIS